MATTDIDGVNLMLLREGTLVTLVLGDKSYLGTLKMRKEGFQENWYIALDEGGEIQIHKRTGAVEITTVQAGASVSEQSQAELEPLPDHHDHGGEGG